MARFGRSFVQAATQPQYAQGLFTAAQQIGAAPARRRIAEEERRKKKKKEKHTLCWQAFKVTYMIRFKINN